MIIAATIGGVMNSIAGGGAVVTFPALVERAGEIAFSRLVNRPVALSMAVGAMVGGYVGSRMSQRVGQRLVRVAIIVIGSGRGLAMRAAQMRR